MLKSLILTLALLGGHAYAAQPSDPMHDATPSLASAADTPSHDCPCLTDHDCAVPERVAEEAASMKLTDLSPAWITSEGRAGLGVAFDCPCGSCAAAPHGLSRSDEPVPSVIEVSQRRRIFVFFDSPIDGGQPLAGTKTWQRSGTTFADLTLSPSVVLMGQGHEHGFIRGGLVTS